MKLTLERLKLLKMQCDAVVSQRALSFKCTGRVSKLGTLAKRQIEFEIGPELDALKGRAEQIRSRYRTEIHEKIDKKVYTEKEATAAFIECLKQDEGYKSISTEEVPLWLKEVEFEFKPVPVEVEKDFVDKTVKVNFGTYSIDTDPYMTLLSLIEEGFLVTDDEF